MVGLCLGSVSHAQDTPQKQSETVEKPAALDWERAIAAYVIGERNSPMVFTMKDSARCAGRWKLHAEAIDDYAFPDAAMRAFPYELRLPAATFAGDFFLMDEPDIFAARRAADEAGRLLNGALSDDATAAYAYFENLGLCSTLTETVRDEADEATDAPAEVENLPNGDFDEPVNIPKLAVIESFVQRLREGKPVADLLHSQISFSYAIESRCGAVTTGSVEDLPAADIDSGFTFGVTYGWENPDCDVPPATSYPESFSLKGTVSHWNSIEFAAEDHNLDEFYVSSDGQSGYMMVHIAAEGDDYAIISIEYREDFVKS